MVMRKGISATTTASRKGRKAQEVHAHKLFAPPPAHDVIRRETILHRIFQHERARIVLLQAPAGHGKSTALHQIKSACESQGHLTAWLTLDEADNDTRRFLIHLQALLASARGVAGAAPVAVPEEIDDAVRRHRSDWVIDRLLGLGRPVALFLDDFQVLDNPTILGFFRELLERVPQNARVFIGSRSTPEVGLSRLIVNGQALMLRPEDLRFSAAEVEEFFNGRQETAISHEEVDGIYRRTEGWPAALQLYRLSLMNPAVRRSLSDFSASRPRELADYLADNVLAMQPPHIQDFLLRTSLLTRMSAPLCAAVAGRRDSQDILLRLERSGLFVRSVDPQMRWFEYHGLFASFLAEQLHDRSQAIAMEVHRRAARWHQQHENHEETIHHAIACRDFSLAAETLDVWASQLVAGAHLITMERWCDRLPFEEIACRPSLLIKHAWALVFLRRREKLRPLLALLEERQAPFDVCQTTDPRIVLSMAAIARDDPAAAFTIVAGVPIREPRATAFAAFELAAAANLTGFREIACGEFERARQFLAIARSQGERGDATFSRGYTIGVTGVSLLLEGELREALERFRTGMAEQRMHVDQSYASAALASCYIWALYEANELDAAEGLFGQYHDVIAEAALLDFLTVAQVCMARIHDVRGRPAKALAVLDEAADIGHANDTHRYLRGLSWERVRRALLVGDIPRAESIVAAHSGTEINPADPWLLFSEDLEGEGLGRIRFAIHSGDLDGAENRLETEFARHRGRVFRQIKLYLLDAQLHYRKGSRNIAQRSLRKALQLAGPGRYIRCFLDEGEQVLGMLREEYQSLVDSGGRDVRHGTDRSFVEQLLQASGTDLSRGTQQAAARSTEALTERELEILVFLGNGVSNKEMGERLFVTENTVKFHLKNIYAKLAVASRLQAIASARELGLVK